MPPGFGLIDTALIAIPVGFALLGLVRGAPVELASTLGCLAGVAAAWAIGLVGPVQELGSPGAPLLALAAGLVVWRVTRNLSQMAGLDTRWFDLGGVVDMIVGFVMAGGRGLALTGAACLAYATLVAPLGLPSGSSLVTYPYYVAGGVRVTNAVVAAAPEPIRIASLPANLDAVPMPIAGVPATPQASGAPIGVPPALATVMHALAPPAAAATQPVIPQAVIPRPDIPVRGIPAAMYETHHNLRHPYGTGPVRRTFHN